MIEEEEEEESRVPIFIDVFTMTEEEIEEIRTTDPFLYYSIPESVRSISSQSTTTTTTSSTIMMPTLCPITAVKFSAGDNPHQLSLPTSLPVRLMIGVVAELALDVLLMRR